jgi:hypothetical protein
MDDPGIRVFDTGNNREITGAPVDTGLPPFCLVQVNDSSSEPIPPGDDNETTIPSEPVGCPVEFLFGEEHPLTERCRIFRDDVLLNFEAGRQAVKIYYIYASEITELLRSDRELSRKAVLFVRLLFSETAKYNCVHGNDCHLEKFENIKKDPVPEFVLAVKEILNLIIPNNGEQGQKH